MATKTVVIRCQGLVNDTIDQQYPMYRGLYVTKATASATKTPEFTRTPEDAKRFKHVADAVAWMQKNLDTDFRRYEALDLAAIQ